ncbi:hypothetical protein SAMN05216238_101204 [Lentibacillus persicus]|uniref:Alpha-ribazole kinase n=1 Tax=Lentibacillus persicus TaxID=640948 RepID=A0A1I1SCU2_9BACI|nr:hypothetical protein [Lentibacillus persicus]SFD40820.1 hypothetical protein SAMN05216238_101204 [Lentibacillus persicus]
MSNVVVVPLTVEQELVIASDNSGAIGEKPDDAVRTSNSVVGRFACRVAAMECLAAGGDIQTVVIHNFTSDEAWPAYKYGVAAVLNELGSERIPMTGSSESNFAGLQSGFGLTIIGTRPIGKTSRLSGREAFAVIGKPLVGKEVLEQYDDVAPLWLFQHLCRLESVKAVLPVGSKGIAEKWRGWTHRSNKLECVLNLEKSAGPATCFLIAFDKDDEPNISSIAGRYFHRLLAVESE